MKRLIALCLLLLPGLVMAQQQSVNCSAGVACTPNGGPQNTGTGDPIWKAFGKLNANEGQLYGMFGPSSNLATGGSASAADIAGLFGGGPGVGGCLGANGALNQCSGVQFNVMNYGAKCDWNGTTGTDDTLAYNAAFAAARTSPYYLSMYQTVKVVGCLGLTNSTSLVGTGGFGIDATRFNVWQSLGNGVSGGGLIVDSLNVHCSDPTSNAVVCLDESDSINVINRDIKIVGDTTNPALVGFQEANPIVGHACCIHKNYNMQVLGNFVWTAHHAMGAESTVDTGSDYGNYETARGSIASINFTSTLAGCTALAATYNQVPSTGGGGVNASFQVKMTSGGAVSTVVTHDAGWGFFPNDTVTIPFNATNFTGAGCTSGAISITIPNVVAFAEVYDGENHWSGPLSTKNSYHWTGVTLSQDTQISYTQLTVLDGSARSNTAGIWMAALTSPNFKKHYVNSESATLAYPGYWSYDCTGIATCAANANLHFEDMRVETNKSGGVGDIYFTGPQVGPTLTNLYYHVDFEKGNITTASSIFMVDPGVAYAQRSISLPNIDLAINFANKFNTFPVGKAHFFAATGHVQAQLGYQFNYPDFWKGSVCAGQFLPTVSTPMNCEPPYQGVFDVLGIVQSQMSFAYSCMQQLWAQYTGPLCQMRRASDGATADIYPDTYGLPNKTAETTFCAGTTCSWSVPYDQSGHSNPGAQTTAANQASVNISDANFGGKNTMGFTSGGATSYTVANATNNQNIWSAAGGGTLLAVIFRSGSHLAPIVFKTDGATEGYTLQLTSSSKLEFIQQSSTSASDYVSTNTVGATVNVIDMEYTSNCANTPAINLNGTAVTFTTATPCVGTPGSDAASAMIIGNNAATGGTEGFPGTIGLIAAASTSSALNANQLEGMRRWAAFAANITSPVVQ